MFNSYSLMSNPPLLKSGAIEGTSGKYVDSSMPKDIKEMQEKYKFNDFVYT